MPVLWHFWYIFRPSHWSTVYIMVVPFCIKWSPNTFLTYIKRISTNIQLCGTTRSNNNQKYLIYDPLPPTMGKWKLFTKVRFGEVMHTLLCILKHPQSWLRKIPAENTFLCKKLVPNYDLHDAGRYTWHKYDRLRQTNYFLFYSIL